MKHVLTVLLLLFLPVCLAACMVTDLVPAPEMTESSEQIDAFNAAMDDWLKGKEYGIVGYTYSPASNSVNIRFSADAYARLTEQDKNDISLAVIEQLSIMPGGDECSISYTIVK